MSVAGYRAAPAPGVGASVSVMRRLAYRKGHWTAFLEVESHQVTPSQRAAGLRRRQTCEVRAHGPEAGPFAPHRRAPCRRASPVHTPRPPRPIRRDPGSVTSHLRRGDPVEPGGLGQSLPPEGLSTSWRRISLRGGSKDAASPRGEGPSPFRCSFFVTTPSPRVRGAQGDSPQQRVTAAGIGIGGRGR